MSPFVERARLAQLPPADLTQHNERRGRCANRHPSLPEVRCEERAGHVDEQIQHGHSFYARYWADEEKENR